MVKIFQKVTYPCGLKLEFKAEYVLLGGVVLEYADASTCPMHGIKCNGIEVLIHD